MTLKQEKERHLKREILDYKKRKEELRLKIMRKREEGVKIANKDLFEECYAFFCEKAKVFA